MFFNSKVCGSVILFNSRFRRNIAKGDGALFAQSEIGTLTLNITKVHVSECAAETYRCVLLVGDAKPGNVTK